MPSLSAGDIVVLFDGTIRPPKHKWFVAAYVAEGWFFRLNSKPHWRPNFELPASQNPCLEDDCYIELRGIIEYWEGEVEQSLRYPDSHKGRLSDDTIHAFIAHLPTVNTLTSEEIEIVTRELKAVLSE